MDCICIVPSSVLVSKTSRKASWLFCSSSLVNLMLFVVLLIVCKMSSVLSLLTVACENIVYVSVPSLNVSVISHGSLFQILHNCFSKKTGQRRTHWCARDLSLINNCFEMKIPYVSNGQGGQVCRLCAKTF